MHKTTLRPRAGFTLIELLTVIAIIGILASILFPAIGAAKKSAQKANDMSNIRSIGQASMIFAQDNNDQFPGTKISTTASTYGQNDATSGADATVKLIAQALAVSGGLESAGLWVSKADETTLNEAQNSALSTVLNDDKDGPRTTFSLANLAVGYVAGINSSSYPSTTPLAFTRGLLAGTAGKWNETTGTYGADGGYIVFIGGNVTNFKSLGASDTAGKLTSSTGALTNDITKTVKTGKTVKFLEEDNKGTDGYKSVSPAGN